MNPTNPESDLNISPSEHIGNENVLVIDQDHANYPYKISDTPMHLELMSDPLGGSSPASREGFYHNNEAHRNAGRKIASLLKLPQNSKVIDIGWGRNSFIADGLRSAGLDVSLIDYNTEEVEPDPNDPLTLPPVELDELEGKFHNFAGNVADISHPNSALKDAKFDLATFNGSWLAGGYNCTVSESLEARLHQKYGSSFPGYNDPRVIADMDEYRMQVLSNVCDHINPGGYIYFGSSRFAYHGAGYEFDDYPREKLNQLDLMAQMRKLGAKKVLVIGVTNDKMKEALRFNLTDPDILSQREAQILGKLVYPSPFTGKAEISLVTDGKNPTYEQLKEIVKDPAKRAQVLKNSIIAKRVREMEEDNRRLGESTLSQLTGGVFALPDRFSDYDMLTAEKSQRVKRETKDVMPDNIARIDALAFQF